ncbi:MAG TPA: hypothetical protein VFJ14_11195 [Nocardioidaceae bacterium]|nr:hypothetical protein [Nocardioidaceae bacterium]
MLWKRGRGLAAPSLVTLAVFGFVAYMWFQGRAHTVEFAVTRGEVAFVQASEPRVPEPLRARAPTDRMLLVDASWEAAEAIEGGSYYVLVAAPPGWKHYACEPECDWGTTQDLRKYADALPLRTARLGAQFDADESGRVRVAFVPGDGAGTRDPTFQPAAWLVQTDGDNVLHAKLIS